MRLNSVSRRYKSHQVQIQSTGVTNTAGTDDQTILSYKLDCFQKCVLNALISPHISFNIDKVGLKNVVQALNSQDSSIFRNMGPRKSCIREQVFIPRYVAKSADFDGYGVNFSKNHGIGRNFSRRLLHSQLIILWLDLDVSKSFFSNILLLYVLCLENAPDSLKIDFAYQRAIRSVFEPNSD